VDGPTREQLAAVTRQMIEKHQDWDSAHEFVIWTWDGRDLALGTLAVIDPAMHPLDYPAMMARVVASHREKHPDPPPYAFVLQIEAFGVAMPGKDATEAQRARVRAAQRTRTFHELPEAVESCIAYCADIHGRLWAAGKRRDGEGISEAFYPPGRGLGGQMVKGLLAVAYACGMADYGLPGPQDRLN
jgi:hypothetical protein